jgi:hypothetical protein
MDIRKSKESTKETENKSSRPAKTSTATESVSYKAGTLQTADAKLILPPAIQGKLSALSTKYGIPFDLSNIALDGKMAENIKAFRKIVEMVEGDSKLLPEMLKLIKRLMKSEISLAKFHRGCVTASLKHQEKLDKVTADIFLKMSGYQQKASKREHRTNVRNQLIEKRSQAYTDYYQNTVYGAESQIIDVEFETLASNKKILSESKTKQVKFNAERKQKINEYVQSAFTD